MKCTIENWLKAYKAQSFDELEKFEYDLYWELATASKHDLLTVCDLIISGQYIDLPIPYQTIAFRLMGLENLNDKELVELAVSGMTMYC